MKRIATVAAITAVVVLGGGSGVWAAGSISGDNIKANTIDSGEIQNNTLTTTDIKDGTLSGADVADASLTGSDIKDGSLGSNDLVTGAVGSVQIKDGSITAGDIRQDTITYIEQQANMMRGGKTGIVAYAQSSSGGLQSATYKDGNGVTVSATDGDYLTIVNATFVTTVPVRVSLQSNGGYEVGSCIADPAGFGKASCSVTLPGTVPYFQATIADGTDAGSLSPYIELALVKVG